jgi:CPA2 family monovalent cation:H+ antiporter-2
MQEDHGLPFLRELILFLAVAGLVMPALKRWRISPVLGFLLAGVLLGPSGAGRLMAEHAWLGPFAIADSAEVESFAEIGVILLMFMIGLELSLTKLWELRRFVLGLGTMQILLCAAAIGGVAYAFDNAFPAAVVLGLCLALSSTAVVMQLLIEQKRRNGPAGQTAFSILLAQDLAVVPILVTVGVLAGEAEGGLAGALGMALAKAVAAVVIIVALGRWALRPLFRWALAEHSPETFVALCLLAIVATAVVTGAAGLSLALGAFLAGLVLAETEYRHAVEAMIEPFRGLFLGLFFLAVGLGIDIHVVVDRAGWLLLSVLGLAALKAAIIALLARVFGRPWPVALETGLLLAQGGEFAFVVVGVALSGGLLEPAVAQFMLIVTALSMAATPLLALASKQTAALFAARAGQPVPTGEAESETEEAAEAAPQTVAEGGVLIIGYGRVGSLTAEALRDEGIAFVAVDRQPVQTDDGTPPVESPVIYGDATQTDLLRLLKVERARLVLVTSDDHEVGEAVVAAVRTVNPEAMVIARARDVAHAQALRRAGADVAVPETLEASLEMIEVALRETGMDGEEARAVVHRRRMAAQEALDGAA